MSMQDKMISGYINTVHGSSVSDQFDCTYNGSEGFDDQNINALKYIRESITEVIKSEVFEDMSHLISYSEDLADYMTKEKN